MFKKFNNRIKTMSDEEWFMFLSYCLGLATGTYLTRHIYQRKLAELMRIVSIDAIDLRFPGWEDPVRFVLKN